MSLHSCHRHPSVTSPYTYVDHAAALAEVTRRLDGAGRVGLDTEADSLHHYFEKVCLIQISVEGTQYIIDPLSGISLEAFLATLTRTPLILQGADYDLRMLHKSFGFRPQAPVFDTKLAAHVLGHESVGLAALAARYCGVALSKSSQKADWSRRPLPERQLTYAADDTRYLMAIADAQTAELTTLQRLAWHVECCERVVSASTVSEPRDEEAAWRVKGSFKLSPNELVYVRALWQWRDAEARAADRPPFYVLLNEGMIALATWRAGHQQAPLDAGPAWLQRVTGGRRARLAQAIRAADHTPQADWPQPLPRQAWAPSAPEFQRQVDDLLAACKTVAQELRIESSFLASRAALTSVVQHRPQSLEQVMSMSGLMRWQATLLLPAIQRVLGR